MEAPESLPFVARVDDSCSPADVLDVVVLGAFVAGTHPWAQRARLQRVRPEARLLPPGVEPRRASNDSQLTTVLAEGDGWWLCARRWTDATADVLVTAARDELAREVLAAAIDGAVAPLPPDESTVPIGFWYRHTCNRAYRVERIVTAEPWDTIRRNYARTTASALDQLVALDPATTPGRLVLVHGPPGTGKTTALRALAHAWRPWCRVDFVLDSDRMFNDVSYLVDVALNDAGRSDDDGDEDGDAEGDGTGRRWRMLVLEDCDELLRADAKAGAGQALSRLLNLTDGVVGQGLDLLICLTTNEDVHRLHPAITRPGRCLAQIHIGPLPYDEATAWLGRTDGIGRDGATLAELYVRRGDLHKVSRPEPERPSGLYL